MFAPKRGHVTHCVTRDGLTFVPFLSSCCIRCRRLVENKSSRKFTVFVVLKVREIARNKLYAKTPKISLATMCPGFDSRTPRHMWTEFVGFLLCSERFSPGIPVFPSHQKSTFDLIYLIHLISSLPN